MAEVTFDREEAADDGLPMICACCGGPAEASVPHRFTRGAFGFLLLPGLLYAFGQKVEVPVPLCRAHLGHFTRGRWFGWLALASLLGGPALGVVLLIGSFLAAAATGSGAWVGLGFMSALTVMILGSGGIIGGQVGTLLCHLGGIRPAGFTNRTITLMNVSPAFADAVEGRDEEVYDALVPGAAPAEAGRGGRAAAATGPEAGSLGVWVKVPLAVGGALVVGVSLAAGLFVLHAPRPAAPSPVTLAPTPPLPPVPQPPQPRPQPPQPRPPQPQPPQARPEPPKDPPAHILAPGKIVGRRGLAGYWPLDEGRGDRAKEMSGRQTASAARLTGAAWVDGHRGSALEFDGKGASLDYGVSAAFDFPKGGGFTVAGWLRTKATDGAVVSQRDSRNGAALLDLLLTGGRLAGHVRSDKGGEAWAMVAEGPPVNDGKWHHFALARKASGELRLFVDAVEYGRPGWNDDGPITTDLRRLGVEEHWVRTKWPGRPYFAGAIDEFCIFDRALPAEEVAELAAP